MSLLTSSGNGYDHIGWRGLLRAALLVWLMPGAFGALLVGLQWLAGTRDIGTGWRTLWTYSVLLLGMAIGAGLTVLTRTDLALSMAAVWVLGLRLVLGRWHPDAFVPAPGAV